MSRGKAKEMGCLTKKRLEMSTCRDRQLLLLSMHFTPETGNCGWKKQQLGYLGVVESHLSANGVAPHRDPWARLARSECRIRFTDRNCYRASGPKPRLGRACCFLGLGLPFEAALVLLWVPVVSSCCLPVDWIPLNHPKGWPPASPNHLKVVTLASPTLRTGTSQPWAGGDVRCPNLLFSPARVAIG